MVRPPPILCENWPLALVLRQLQRKNSSWDTSPELLSFRCEFLTEKFKTCLHPSFTDAAPGANEVRVDFDFSLVESEWPSSRQTRPLFGSSIESVMFAEPAYYGSEGC